MTAQRIEERRCDFALAQSRADAFGIVEQGEEVGLRQQAAERLEHCLPASHIQQPVMNNGHAHIQ